ncbi:hypothetical protein WA026_020787 [Henosepilachna vigintioctopunctata]|uniref:TLC domain-containing protein n=1 Tax=Henosepilachna vigintioctopunctata TaxID=420089 RepID=A0AAW1TRT9_9CUCU
MSSNTINAIAFSTILWTLCYKMFRRIFPTKSPEYNCRLATVIHGGTTAIVGLNQCFLNENPFHHPNWVTTNLQSGLLIFSLGYFIYDLCWCCYYKTETGLMIVHHVFSIVALKSILWKGYSGGQTSCCLGFMEVTNPFLQLRWLLRYEGYHSTMLFTAVEIFFFTLFFIVRVLIGTYILLNVLFEEKNDTDFKLGIAFFYVISMMFVFRISKYVVKNYGPTGRFWKSRIERPSHNVL